MEHVASKIVGQRRDTSSSLLPSGNGRHRVVHSSWVKASPMTLIDMQGILGYIEEHMGYLGKHSLF